MSSSRLALLERHRYGIIRHMVSLSDNQLKIVMDAAAGLKPERRDIFLQRCGAMLRMRGRFTDADVAEVARLAMAGLIQQGTDTAA